jgi:protocatechuate 3,4-dioxygenase beta subunit
MRAIVIPALFLAALAPLSAGAARPEPAASPGCPGARPTPPAPVARAEPACEWCGAAEAPARLTSEVRLAPPGEAGEPLFIAGRVLRADGRTPAAGVLLYLYQTNAAGAYPRRGSETENGRRHGYLRGWLRTDARGNYCVATIRPGGHPGRPDPAHIHATVTEPGQAEGYIDEFVFADDPRVTPAMRAKPRPRGGSGVVRLVRTPDGVWRGERTIVLRDVGR